MFPPLRTGLKAYEFATRDPLYQLPVGSVHLSAPPVLNLDKNELAQLRAARRAQQYAARNRGKLLRIKEGGNGKKGFLIPQSARLKEHKSRERREQMSRRIKEEKREAIEAMREKAKLASRFAGELNEDALSATGGLSLDALRRPQKFSPGSSHLKIAKRTAEEGQMQFENSFNRNTLERELFKKANSLQAEFTRDWQTFTGPRARQLQKVARTHLIRRALEIYGQRVEETRRLVEDFVRNRETRWLRIVFKAFARIATKRLYFRMLLVRSRRILTENRACKCFHAWKMEAASPHRRDWRRRYYGLMLHGSRSRQSRMKANFVAWHGITSAMSFVGRLLGRHLQRCMRQWIRGRYLLRAEQSGVISTIQSWWRLLKKRWVGIAEARSLADMLKSRKMLEIIADSKGKYVAARTIQRQWKAMKERVIKARARAQKNIAKIWRGACAKLFAHRLRSAAVIRRKLAAMCIANFWTSNRLRKDPLDYVVLKAYSEREENEFEDWFWMQSLEVELWCQQHAGHVSSDSID